MNVLTKTISITLLALTPFICLPQVNAQTAPKSSTATIKPTTVSCAVSADEKRIITRDDESWTVANPQALKGHAGDYVSITAEFDESKRAVTVKSVKVIEANAVNRPKMLNKKDNYTSA